MPGEALDGMRHREHLANARVVRVESADRYALRRYLVELVPPRDERAEAVYLLERQAEHLANLAQRALAAVRDHLAHHRGAVAPVPVVNRLDHLFASLVLEVDVDVRGLSPFGGEESLEEQATARRVHRRDTEAEAHRAVGRAATPLAEDVARPRHLHDPLHAQEIGRSLEFDDERELFLDLRAHLIGQAVRKARPDAFVREAVERLVGRLALVSGVAVAREAVRELTQRKAARVCHVARPREPRGAIGERAFHLVLRLQARLGVGQEGAPGVVERHPFADAMKDVLHRFVFA